MSDQVIITTVAKCPRCGYDLRGTIASWLDSCPLSGTCTECGLELAWARLLHPSVLGPNWCIEYYRMAAEIPVRMWRTFLMTLQPGRLWRDLEMIHQCRPKRIALFLGLLLSAAAFWCCGSSFAAILFGTWHEVPSSVVMCPLLAALLHLTVPVGFVAIPVSIRRAKVRVIHLARVTLYGLTWLAWFFVLPIVVWLLTIVEVHSRIDLGTVRVLRLSIVGSAIMMVPALVVWWSQAIGNHLKIPHAQGVAAAIVALSVLVLLAIVMIVPGGGVALIFWYDDLIDDAF